MKLIHKGTGTSWHWYTGRLGRHDTGTQGDWDVTDGTGTKGDWDVTDGTGTQGDWDVMALGHRETGTSWHWYTGRLGPHGTGTQGDCKIIGHVFKWP